MVRGIDRFREHFSGYTDQFVLIGGAACDLIMDEAGLSFRGWFLDGGLQSGTCCKKNTPESLTKSEESVTGKI